MKRITFLLLAFSSPFLTVTAQTSIISTLAGTSKAGYNNDGIKANLAQLNQDGGVAVDDSGNVYIADSQNNRIRKIYKRNGIIATIAGTGVGGYSGDSGRATLAQCTYPICVRVDSLRDVYFSDAGNGVIRKIDAEGIINTVAGNGMGGYAGDSGKAIHARLNYPVGIALDKNLNLYIADQSNNVIRKVTYGTGIINTIAGNHTAGYSGDSGKATAAKLNGPTGVAIDNAGNIYIADFKNNVIRRVDNAGMISTVAGTGVAGFNNFAGPALYTKMNNPAGVSCDAAGNIYIADAGDGVVRKLTIATKQMVVLAGIADDGFAGDGGPADKAKISYPFDIVSDKKGNVYIADLGNNRIRKISESKIASVPRAAQTPVSK